MLSINDTMYVIAFTIFSEKKSLRPSKIVAALKIKDYEKKLDNSSIKRSPIYICIFLKRKHLQLEVILVAVQQFIGELDAILQD